MGRKLTVVGILCFVALAGLSVGSVSCLSMMKMDLKVEAVHHDGITKKYLSYVNYTSTNPNGVVKKKMDERDPWIAKSTVFLERIPSLNLSPSIFDTASATTCLRKDDIRIKTGNTSLVWTPYKMEQWHTGLLRQCTLANKVTTVVTPPLQGIPWYLDGTCLSAVQSIRIRSLTKSAFPLYTIYISTSDRVMMFNPLAKFNVSSFLRGFPFDRMEIEYVVVSPVTLCNAGNRETVKTAMKQIGYAVQEDLMSGAIVFEKSAKAGARVPGKTTLKTTTTITPKSQVTKKEVTTTRTYGFFTTPVPKKVTPQTTMRPKIYVVRKDSPPVYIIRVSAAVAGKPIGNLSLLIGIVGIVQIFLW